MAQAGEGLQLWIQKSKGESLRKVAGQVTVDEVEIMTKRTTIDLLISDDIPVLSADLLEAMMTIMTTMRIEPIAEVLRLWTRRSKDE